MLYSIYGGIEMKRNDYHVIMPMSAEEIRLLKDAADKIGHSIRIFVRDAALKEARVIRKGGAG